jgi:hypothetical protein
MITNHKFKKPTYALYFHMSKYSAYVGFLILRFNKLMFCFHGFSQFLCSIWTVAAQPFAFTISST